MLSYIVYIARGWIWCGGGEKVPDIPGACATCNFAYLSRGPLLTQWSYAPFALFHQYSLVQHLMRYGVACSVIWNGMAKLTLVSHGTTQHNTMQHRMSSIAAQNDFITMNTEDVVQ